MTRHLPTFGLIAASFALGGCWYGTYEYPQAQYFHRTDTITTSAGNAQKINEVTQVIDPWRHGVANRRIPATGERMVNAAERYRARSAGGSSIGGSSGQTGQQPAGGASPGGAGASPSGSTGGAQQ
jgi:hypothetical protein